MKWEQHQTPFDTFDGALASPLEKGKTRVGGTTQPHLQNRSLDPTLRVKKLVVKCGVNQYSIAQIDFELHIAPEPADLCEPGSASPFIEVRQPSTQDFPPDGGESALYSGGDSIVDFTTLSLSQTHAT